MVSSSNHGAGSDPYERLASSADKDILSLKSDLVLQLYTRNGSCWEAVQEVRERWRIEASTEPPLRPSFQILHPPRLSHAPPTRSQKREHEEWFDTYEAWIADLESIARTVVPYKWIGDKFRPDWGSFFSACVLHDPSVPGLLKFADFGGPWAESLPLEPGKDYHNGVYVMLKPPIVEAGDLAEEKRLREACLRKNRRRRYIMFDEDTTGKDVENARRLLAQAHDSRSGQGAPGRDQLVAVECAEIYAHHNTADPDDGRRKAWPLARLAREYGLGSEKTARAYVRVGRAILAERTVN